MRLTTASGTRLGVQTWPVAYWPDGSVKWTGHALAAIPGLAGPLTLTPLATPDSAPATVLTVTESADAFTIDTGAVRARISRQPSAPTLIESLTIGGRTVAQNGRLLALREDRSTPGVRRDLASTSTVERLTLEQSGTVRAVIKLEGRHREAQPASAPASSRSWLPFTIRLHFFAGSGAITLTHSVIFDGDPHKDFIKGLGLTFDVPFAEEPHNRHVRFVGDTSTATTRLSSGEEQSSKIRNAGLKSAGNYSVSSATSRINSLANTLSES